MSGGKYINCPHGIPSGLYCGVCSEIDAGDVDAILAQRGSHYGPFTKHASVTQDIKRILFDCRHRESLAADQAEALDMIAHKLGRIVNGDPDYADSWVDIAGYAKLVADRLLARGEG
jgi:hypothetical protein